MLLTRAIPLALSLPALFHNAVNPRMMADEPCDDGCDLPAEAEFAQIAEQLNCCPGELSVLSLPNAPDASLSHVDVVKALCRGLQFPHVPTQNAGALRLHEFCTYSCKVSLTSLDIAKAGPEEFAEEALLWSLVGGGDITIDEDHGSFIPATQTRGAIATVMVEKPEELSFRFPSGFQRTQEGAEKTEATKKPVSGEVESWYDEGVRLTTCASWFDAGVRLNAYMSEGRIAPTVDAAAALLGKGNVWGVVASVPRARLPSMREEESEEAEDGAIEGSQQHVARYLFQLQQERRPPLMGCWLLQSITPVREYQLFAADGNAV